MASGTARAIRSLKAEESFRDGANRPFLHLVDGGVSDNVGMRAVLDTLEIIEALHEAGVPSPLDGKRRIVVFIVNSLSSPPTDWDRSESPPGMVDVLLKAERPVLYAGQGVHYAEAWDELKAFAELMERHSAVRHGILVALTDRIRSDEAGSAD